jgi:hypothetical protein
MQKLSKKGMLQMMNPKSVPRSLLFLSHLFQNLSDIRSLSVKSCALTLRLQTTMRRIFIENSIILYLLQKFHSFIDFEGSSTYLQKYLEVPTHNVYDIVNTVVLIYQTLLRSLHVSVHRTIIR